MKIQELLETKQRLDAKCWKGYKKQGTKMKGDTRVNNCVPESAKQGLAEGSGDIGQQIRSLYQKIYSAGDDAVEFAYYDSPVFAQYWDQYEGDLDSIIAEVDPQELQVILAELQSAVEEQGVAEAGPFSYGKAPRKGSVADLAAKKRKEQEKGKQPVEPKDQMVGVAKVTKGVAEGLDADQKKARQVPSTEMPKKTSPVLGKAPKQHPFKGRAVGESQ